MELCQEAQHCLLGAEHEQTLLLAMDLLQEFDKREVLVGLLAALAMVQYMSKELVVQQEELHETASWPSLETA